MTPEETTHQVDDQDGAEVSTQSHQDGHEDTPEVHPALRTPDQRRLDLARRQTAARREQERAEAQPAEAEDVQPPAPAPPAAGEEPKPGIEVKVDHTTVETLTDERDLDTKLRDYQMHKAADKRLEEAKRIREEAQAEAKRIVEEAKRASGTPAPQTDVPPARQPSQPRAHQPEPDESALLEDMRTAQYGEPKEALAAQRRLITAMGGAAIPQGANLEEIVSRIIEERTAVQTARTKFETDFKDIVENEQLYDFVLYRASEAAKEGAEGSMYDLVTAEAVKVREMLGSKKPDPLTERKARKANLQNLSPGGGARATVLPSQATEIPQSRQDVHRARIAQAIRERRAPRVGQPAAAG